MDGAAHEALIDVIADALSVPTRNVTGARASPRATIRDCVLSTSYPVDRFTARFFLGLRFRAACDSLSRRHRITPPLLNVVVLGRDIPEQGLRLGDLGTVVALLAPTAFIVEFVAAFGATHALVTLTPSDIRAVADDDLVAVRPVSARAS